MSEEDNQYGDCGKQWTGKYYHEWLPYETVETQEMIKVASPVSSETHLAPSGRKTQVVKKVFCRWCLKVLEVPNEKI